MMLYQDAAKSVYDKTKESRKGFTQEQSIAAFGQIMAQTKSMPIFNIQAEISPKTADEIKGFEAIKASVDYNDPATKGVVDRGIKRTSRDAELQSQGVVIDRELPAGSLEIGFSDKALRSVKGALSDYFKTDVKVFKSGDEIIYIDPIEDRPIKANPNAAVAFGKAIPIVTEVAAAFISPRKGAGIKEILAKESGYAGVGNALGEFTKLGIGSLIGANDLTLNEVFEKSAISGAWAAAFTLGVGSLIASVKGIENIRQGRLFNKDDAVTAGVNVGDADEVVKEANKIIQGGEFKPTYGQKTDNALVQSSEKELRVNPEFVEDFRARDIQNVEAEQAALNTIGRQDIKPFTPETVGDVAEQKVSQMVSKQEAPIIASEKQLKSQLDDIGKVKKGLVGEDTLSVINKKTETAKNAYKSLWGDVEKAGGYDEVERFYDIPIEKGLEAKKLESILQRQYETSSTQTGASSVENVFVNRAKQKGKRLIREGTVNRQIVKGADKRANKLQDLADFNREISRLKENKRRVISNPSATDMSVSDISGVIKSLEADRKLALIKSGRNDIIEKIEKAELETAKFFDTYKNSVIGDLTELNKNGISKIKSKDFVDNLIKRDTEEVDNFINIIGDNPDLMMKWKEGLGDAYYRKGFPDGKFSSRASAEWLETNKVILKKFGYTDSQIKGFKRTGEFQKKIAEDRKKFDKFVTNANTKWGSGKLKNLDPRNLVKFVTNDDGSWITQKGQGVQAAISKIKSVKNMVKGNPGAWQTFQNDFKLSLKNELTDPKTGRINHSKLLEWTNAKNKDTVIEVMGKNYYDDLVKIEKVVRMLNKKFVSLSKDEGQRAWIQAIRATAAPPLSKKGRAFTAAIIFRGKKAHEATLKALLDQKTMREVVKLSEHDTVTRRVMEKAYSLGLGLPEEE